MTTSQIVQQQREFFNSNATKPISFRLEQLRQLKSILQPNEPRLCCSSRVDPAITVTNWTIDSDAKFYAEPDVMGGMFAMLERPAETIATSKKFFDIS